MEYLGSHEVGIRGNTNRALVVGSIMVISEVSSTMMRKLDEDPHMFFPPADAGSSQW